MSHFEMQIYMLDPDTGEWVWRSARPTGGEPYKFDTRDEARDELNSCYGPIDSAECRVIPVEG